MFIGFLERLLDADTVEELRSSYFDAMSRLGFSQTLYAARFLASLPQSVFREDIEVHSNFPPQLLHDLKTRNLLTDSACAQWVRRNSGSISTGELALQTPTTVASDEAMKLARLHGVDAGHVISLRDKVLRSHGAIVLSPYPGATHEEVQHAWAEVHREVTSLSWVMHMRMATIQRGSTGARLTNRQREVLEWSSAGKTVAEIATILAVAPATIEKHLRLARETLAAGSTAQAILKAHLTHQIFVQIPIKAQSR